jgi:hypothetical protein
MMGPDLIKRVNAQSELLKALKRHMANVEERLGFLEAKMDQHMKVTKDGNSTRNIIAIMVAAKVLFEGFGSLDWTAIGHLIKTLNGLGG